MVRGGVMLVTAGAQMRGGLLLWRRPDSSEYVGR